MVAEMSFLLQVNVLQLTMWLKWDKERETWPPFLKALIEKKTLKTDEDPQHWADGKGASAWVPAATILLPELPIPVLVAQYCLKCFCSFYFFAFLRGLPSNSQINQTHTGSYYYL